MKVNVDEIEINEISTERLNEYLDLVSLVKSNMEHPEWLGDFSKEDYLELIKNGSHIYGWFYNNELIAAGVLIPSTKHNLDKFFSSELNYEEVVDFGPQMVHIKYIGNHLQSQIIDYLEIKSLELGYKYALSTIHPDNIYSIKNLINSNFKDIGFIELKRGPRKIYRKKF